MPILFLLAGIIAIIIVSRQGKRKRTGATRAVYVSARSKSVKAADQIRRDAERSRREQFERRQAENDIIHYTQVKKDLLTAYNASGAVDGDTEKAIRKRIQYDNAIRRTEKQIEKAIFDARRTGL